MPDEDAGEQIPEEGATLRVRTVNPLTQTTEEELPIPNDEEPITNRPLVNVRANMGANLLPLAIASHQARLRHNSENIQNQENQAIYEINRDGINMYVRGQLTLKYIWTNLQGFAIGPRLVRRYLSIVSSIGCILMIVSTILAISHERPAYVFIWSAYELLANIVIFCLRRWVHKEAITKFSKYDCSIIILQIIPMVA